MWVRFVGYVIGMIVIAVATGGFFLFNYLKPLEEEKQRIDSEYKKLLAKKKRGAKLKRQIREYSKQISARKKEIVRLLKEKTKGRDVGQFLNNVEIDAKNSGIDLKSIRIHAKTQRQLYIEIPMEFSILGAYFEIYDFLNRIENRKILNLTRSQIQISGGGAARGKKIKNIGAKIAKNVDIKDIEGNNVKLPKYSDSSDFSKLRVTFDGRIIIIDKSHIAKYEEG